ncbi:hypothetical protein VTK73DRAFT_3935 [Phialemonium thermophilum]|uniref:Uncharacterized protein n=1 Tax=Phialemonium thermophilum TaxID=223376 RepID=A0ABR3VDK7_9PEZI
MACRGSPVELVAVEQPLALDDGDGGIFAEEPGGGEHVQPSARREKQGGNETSSTRQRRGGGGGGGGGEERCQPYLKAMGSGKTMGFRRMPATAGGVFVAAAAVVVAAGGDTEGEVCRGEPPGGLEPAEAGVSGGNGLALR